MSGAIFDAPMISPFLVFNRRNRKGNINATPVLALSNCLVMLDPLTAAVAVEDHGFFLGPIGWNKHGYGKPTVSSAV
jgi:hypothetical protein